MHQAQHAREAGDTPDGEKEALRRKAAAFLKKGPAKNFQKVGGSGARRPGGAPDGEKEALRRKAAAFLKKGLAKNFQKVEALGTRRPGGTAGGGEGRCGARRRPF